MERDDSGRALIGGVPVDEVLARAGAPTPAYVYDVAAMAAEARALTAGFGDAPHLVAYAVKANSAGCVVHALAQAGCGAEVGSRGELAVALGVGISPASICFNGVAKSNEEIDAAITAGLAAIQIDAIEEVARIDARAAALGRKARISLRLNPSIQADTHAHIATGHDDAKFGIAVARLADAFAAVDAAANLTLVGLSSHIGSQLTRTDEYLAAADHLFAIVREREARRGRHLELLDVGGGFGIDYGDGCTARPADFAAGAAERARRAGYGDRTLVVEPGRALVGPHGVLVAGVVTVKRSAAWRWLVIDAGMNDLLRPALYGARHRVQATGGVGGEIAYRVVGPVCESSCDFGEWRLSDPPPTRVLLRDAGAYGYTMASHYNGRALPAEVFVLSGGEIRMSRAGGVDAWIDDRLRA
jgi:diaminopimelate decarboxylase